MKERAYLWDEIVGEVECFFFKLILDAPAHPVQEQQSLRAELLKLIFLDFVVFPDRKHRGQDFFS